MKTNGSVSHNRREETPAAKTRWFRSLPMSYRKGQKRKIAEARGLFCHWCPQELGLSVTALARMLSLTPAAMVYAARRGEQITADHAFLIEP
jgi:hypothetical protein